MHVDYLPPFVISLFFLLFVLYYLGLFRFLKLALMSSKKKHMYKSFFAKYFKYNNELSKKDQDRFVIRANYLIHKIRISGRENFRVGINEKLFIIAAYVQLTFGFKRYYLTKFKHFLIYPDAYKNKVTGHMHYGEMNPRGVIVLSWKNLLKGHIITNDAINLGLHEMAHALMYTIINSNEHEKGLDLKLNRVIELSKVEIKNIKNNTNHLFRDYAKINIYEFFAVSVEHFFESPIQFKDELPELYNALSVLLNQDLAKKSDTD